MKVRKILKWLLLGFIALILLLAALIYSGLPVTLFMHFSPNLHATVNGVAFTIPRDYIFFDKFRPDGENKHIGMLFQYPSMELTNKQARREGREIRISIKKNAQIDCIKASPDVCYTISQINTLRAMRTYFRNPDNPDFARYKPVKVRHDATLGMDVYWTSESHARGWATEEYFVRGDLTNPTAWLRCDIKHGSVVNPGCYADVEVNDQIVADYFFRRESFLNEHDAFREKVIATIKGLMDQPTAEESR